MTRMEIVFTSVKAKSDAKKMADAIVKSNFAACVNYWKINSVYRWKGKIIREGEYLLECKCIDAKKALSFIRKIHPYSLPMLYSIPVSLADAKYAKWLKTK